MPDNSNPSNKIRKGLIHLNHQDEQNDFYYPEDAYLEDFELEKNAALKLLENFKPIDKNI